MDVLDSLRELYAEQPLETPAERRKRLANHRAAKYRYLKSLEPAQQQRREKSNLRQRDRRRELDESAKRRIRELNRVRQQQRHQTLSDQTRQEIREKQRQRQQVRRTRLDDDAREALRERERLRVRMRRARDANDRDAAALTVDAASVAASAVTPPHSPLPPLLLSLVSFSPAPASPLVTRHSRTAINANGVLNSELSLSPTAAALQLPPVTGSASTRFEPELPTLQPHLRSIQAQPAPSQPPALGSFQFAALSPVPAMPLSASAGGLSDRIPQLPQLQMALPQASSLLSASTPAPPPPPPSLLFQLAPLPASVASSTVLPGIAAATAGGAHNTVAVSMQSAATQSLSSSSSSTQQQQQQPQQQMLPSIAYAPPVRALPPLPDFLNTSREPFSATNSAFFSLFADHAGEYHDSVDAMFRSC